jgi:phospholipase C
MSTPAPPITNIVVLMMENRSFDNVLGWLYDAQNAAPFSQVPPGQTFEGLNNDPVANIWQGQTYAPGTGTDMIQPYPDPNEPYEHMYMQMFNPDPFVIPSTVPDGSGLTAPATMGGYVADYATADGVSATQAPVIMNCFRPASVPIISTLANWYTVCDHWYSSVPSQTYTNRSFLHAGTASGYVNNWIGPHWDDIFINDTPTIFNLLQDAGVSWGIYYGSYWFFCQALLCQEQLADYFETNFFPFQQFLSDAAAGTLPSYVFIEPNFIPSSVGDDVYPETDEHPDSLDGPPGVDGPSNVLFGEQLISQVFTALSSSPQWNSTMLIILFDEGGGTYDHFPVDAATATAVPPDDVTIAEGQPGYSGFTFGRYGGRVPAVICSPYTAKATVCNTAFDHTSVLATAVQLLLGGTGNLGARTAAANSLLETIALPAARTDLPTLPTVTPPSFDIATLADVKLNTLQKALVASALRFARKHRPAAAAALGTPTVETHADAWRIAETLLKG